MAGIYIHIPFCASRCIYCDFFSTTQLEARNRYVDAVCKEMEQRRDEILTTGETVATVYIGGGTPSQLDIADFQRLFDRLYSLFPISEDAEVTMECNPEDVSVMFLQALRQLPVNRLSYGVQTFDDNRLRLLHRRHTGKKAIDAVVLSHEAGYRNISIDLMFGFPGETLEDWEKDLHLALEQNVTHLSAYSLMYEEGTKLTLLRDEGSITPIDEELSLKMYDKLIDIVKAGGYEHYEISNFALRGYRSRHNSSYWQGTSYLGLGAGAHSYNGTCRRWNVSSLNNYIKGVEGGKKYFEEEQLSTTDLYNEYVMTRLRTCEGINEREFSCRFPTQKVDYFQKMAAPHLQSGNLVKRDGNICLSRKGLFISDTIMSDLFFVKN